MRMIKKLDWNTPLRTVSIGFHWRLALCAVIGAAISVCIWHTCFPHTLLFLKLWVGFATGATVGMILGTLWQIQDEYRHKHTSGPLVLGATAVWGLFAAISIFAIAPDLNAQEQERAKIRALKAANVSAISIQFDDGQPLRIEDPKLISSFVVCTNRAELFNPGRHSINNRFEISIHLADGSSLEYKGGVPEFHLGDISLEFRSYITWQKIIIPGGQKWLNSIRR